MIRRLVELLFEDTPASSTCQRVVIGRTPAGVPRTYRLVRPHRAWPVRLAEALSL